MQNGGSPLSRSDSIQPGTGMAPNPVSQHTFLRGRTLLDQEGLADALSNIRKPWDRGIQIGPFLLPGDDATKHVALIGAPGSGKTVLMRLFMQSTLPLIGREWKGQVAEEDARKLQEETVRVQDEAIRVARRVRQDKNQPVTFRSGESSPRLTPEAVAQREGCVTTVVMSYVWGLIIAAAITIISIPLSWEPGLKAIPIALGSSVLVMGIVKLLRSSGKQPITQVEKSYSEPQDTPPPERQPVTQNRQYDGPFTWDKHRALVYDAKLEVVPQLEGMDLQAPVLILNPFDKRSVAWDMAVDITEPATAKQIASIFIPDEKNSSQPFFANAARQLLEGVMVAFILTRPQQWTLRDVLVALKSGSRLIAVLSSTPETKDLVETYLSNDKESKSIIATIGTKLGPLDVVAALWESASSKVSLRDWLSSESILVLGNDEAYRSSLDVINQVIFKRVVELLLAQPETTLGRTWFFLDEVKEAGNLDALGRLMTKGRSVGASVVLGFQDIDGMYESFGENQAKSILGQCSTKVFLRLDSPETAKWAETVFGEYEAIELKQSASMGESNSQGTSITKGSSSTESTSKGKSSTWQGAVPLGGSNSSTSDSYSTSESSAESTTTGHNRSMSQSAEVAKRNSILAAQFQSLPMTTVASGVNGYIAHHLGASRFQLRNFESLLLPSDSSCPRVSYRESAEQFLKPWTADEEALWLPAKATESAESSAAGNSIKEAQSRYKKGRFLPTTDAENGIRMRDN
jgi:hypothetical protein